MSAGTEWLAMNLRQILTNSGDLFQGMGGIAMGSLNLN